jgi:DNA-directed RNA polymerase sigma subunit (sigma70/sigma32)
MASEHSSSFLQMFTRSGDGVEAHAPESFDELSAVDGNRIHMDGTVLSGELTARCDALLSEHTDLVRRIAYHLFRRRTYVNVDDLVEAGMVALREAMRGHEHDTAVVFEAYASVLIRAAMLDFVRKSDWSLRSGRSGGRPV